MALRLQGIDPRPLAPRGAPAAKQARPPAVAIETLPTDSTELIEIWRPQALLKAQNGESEFGIARFLHSKGVEGAAARLAAKDIVANPAPAHKSANRLRRVLGWGFLGLGLTIPLASFSVDAPSVLTVLFALLAAALGGKLLWNPRGNP
jgi:hypothetical protein